MRRRGRRECRVSFDTIDQPDVADVETAHADVKLGLCAGGTGLMRNGLLIVVTSWVAEDQIA